MTNAVMDAATESTDAGGTVGAGPAMEEWSPHGEQWALVERAQQGDAYAFGQLYAQYNDDVLRFLRQRCGHLEVAQDLAGDVWERALRNIGRVQRRVGPPLAWLMTIARNRAIDHFRSGRFQYEVLIDATNDISGPDQALDVEQLAVRRQDADSLLRAVKALSGPQRQAIALTYFNGLTCPQAAVRMGISEDAVKALNLRGRRALARRLTLDRAYTPRHHPEMRNR
ncbi:RNA polymerase sigma factor [Hamadaea tsunoensis]|uniref:RNA polymerase sigma factor n=1 Tax=Hamadaea tsunoensis TaxID=53368 RepID=UPI000404008A|nr:RNA polymerase sigma factor [Hamadaea tsunoensis]